MLKALKMKIATNRIKNKSKNTRAKSTRVAGKNNQRFWAKVLNVIYAPFRFIGRIFTKLWLWIRSLDVIGLVNMTLLSAIIVLFSMLILDMTICNKKPVIIIAKNDIEQFNKTDIKNNQEKQITQQVAQTTLPIKRDANRKYTQKTVTTTHVEKCAVTERQTARVKNTLYGDIIIDSRGAAAVLKDGDSIKGNLFIQNMRKYTLPCGMYIDGDLFLRDVNMLQFCGDFTVTGNIYVSPRSSFGPIPRTARLGGQVIL